MYQRFIDLLLMFKIFFSMKSGDTDDEFPIIFKLGQSFSLLKEV